MDNDLKGLFIVILREDLQIHYCDPITMEAIIIKSFKSIDELEEFLNNRK